MIIINPLTFQEVRIDENMLTVEQAEIFRKMGRLTRKINRLQAKQDLYFLALEADTKMKFKDVLKKVAMP